MVFSQSSQPTAIRKKMVEGELKKLVGNYVYEKNKNGVFYSDGKVMKSFNDIQKVLFENGMLEKFLEILIVYGFGMDDIVDDFVHLGITKFDVQHKTVYYLKKVDENQHIYIRVNNESSFSRILQNKYITIISQLDVQNKPRIFGSCELLEYVFTSDVQFPFEPHELCGITHENSQYIFSTIGKAYTFDNKLQQIVSNSQIVNEEIMVKQKEKQKESVKDYLYDMIVTKGFWIFIIPEEYRNNDDEVWLLYMCKAKGYSYVNGTFNTCAGKSCPTLQVLPEFPTAESLSETIIQQLRGYLPGVIKSAKKNTVSLYSLSHYNSRTVYDWLESLCAAKNYIYSLNGNTVTITLF